MRNPAVGGNLSQKINLSKVTVDLFSMSPKCATFVFIVIFTVVTLFGNFLKHFVSTKLLHEMTRK